MKNYLILGQKNSHFVNQANYDEVTANIVLRLFCLVVVVVGGGGVVVVDVVFVVVVVVPNVDVVV